MCEKHVIALEEVAVPDLWGVVGEEGCPCLSSVSRRHLPSSLAQLAPDCAAVDLQTELEQLAPDAFGAPPSILHRHSLEQRDGFLVNATLTSWPLRCVPPEELEPSTVPLEQGVGFDDQQRLFPMRQPTRQHDQETAVKCCEGRVFYLALKDDKLLAQQGVFRDEFRFGPDQIGGGAFDQGRRFGPSLQVHLSFSHDSVED
jgi:hypothetical protein